MKGLNKVMLIGNVGNEPEVKQLPNQHIVARFSLATTETFKNKDGEKNSDTQWHSIIAWNSLAQIVANHVHKGSLLHVLAKIQYRQYADAQNETHYITEIVAEEIILLDKKPVEADGHRD
jgi:single-strand DNA-binding protein